MCVFKTNGMENVYNFFAKKSVDVDAHGRKIDKEFSQCYSVENNIFVAAADSEFWIAILFCLYSSISLIGA